IVAISWSRKRRNYALPSNPRLFKKIFTISGDSRKISTTNFKNEKTFLALGQFKIENEFSFMTYFRFRRTLPSHLEVVQIALPHAVLHLKVGQRLLIEPGS